MKNINITIPDELDFFLTDYRNRINQDALRYLEERHVKPGTLIYTTRYAIIPAMLEYAIKHAPLREVLELAQRYGK